ncbi:hypothetical protein BN1058_00530 [Paraliobacillus sp. PM-2]|uniref:hypothetical protein n=1 Tax=Paraliobacillus sp. PM-2 TaxID=1462524 RepID=UPI00061BD87E|nr:hypothetical protein [Paraliobacillus sp. PM-2]CQR46277.1 hypothetical protein BN1058_00530 [Paraliobacillus sp. PM-2]
MPEIRPIKDVRNTTEIYEKSLAKLELYQKLNEAEGQIKNGEELLDGEQVFRDLNKKHGRK